ncbi:hypothetical protein QZH41_014369 [Actinostola sp. cb2023]|nr:hypothetical protein QZH41_014369 [Actinostola sp. cb2023]
MAEAASSDQTVDQDEESSGEKTETLDKWLYALKEDLASWISRLLTIEITVDTFTSALGTGVVPCKLANFIQNTGEQFFIRIPVCNRLLPKAGVTFKQRGARRGSFIARDNVCNFIRWCREIGVPDVIMFETEDLVSNKNEKAVLLTLLEVARRVFKFGVDPPELVRLENEIDKELQSEPELQPPVKVAALKKKHKSHSLDDLVFEVQKRCTCPSKYPVERITDGKYRMGESKNLIFVRVMRKHVMVRVGGGWDTLDRYFEKHDPCRLTAHRRPSRVSRSSTSSQQNDSFARSPSSTSMASMSSSESYESTGTTASSHLSATAQVDGRRSHSPRNRTLSGGTTSPTYDRCLSPRRGSHCRQKSPSNRGGPPRTIETQGRLSSKCQSMQDLQQRRGSEPVGISSILTPRRRPSSAHRTGTQDSRPSPGSPGQRRRSIAVTPRRNSASSNQVTKKQPVSRTNHQGTSGTRMHRSKSMQALNDISPTKIPNTSTTSSPRKPRPSSAKTRPSSATPDRSRSEGPRNAAPSTGRASTSQVPRRHSNSISCDSPRRRTPITGSPMSSPRISRRSSSTPRGTCGSPASSPRISRRKSSTPREATLVNSPAPMRRAISNVSSPPSRGVTRSASFGSKKDSGTQLLNNGTTKQQSSRQQGGMSGLPRPKGSAPKQSKVPIKVPGKQTPAKQPANSSTPVRRAKQQPASHPQNGSPRRTPVTQEQHHPPHDPCRDTPTPFDNYSVTSEDTSSLVSDKDEMFLGTTESDFNADQFGLKSEPNKWTSSNGSTTPDTIKTLDSFVDATGDGLSPTASEYDFLDFESDMSGLKSPRSISSGYSFGLSPTKELLDSHEFVSPVNEEADEVGNVGILERLQSLNVGQSSVRATLRGKIFTQTEPTPPQATLDTQQPPGTFSASKYMQKEPEERSKFFDIEREFPVDSTDGNADASCPNSPRKFSLVSALIGSIEKRNEPRPTARKKKTDSFEVDRAGEDPALVRSGLPTEPRTGGEAVTGSCGSTQECETECLPKPPIVVREEPPACDNHYELQLDENYNLQSKQKPTENNTADHRITSIGDDIMTKLDEQTLELEADDVKTTGSPKHKDMDSYPRPHRKCSLEDMIEDMLPSNDTGKEPAFQALI